MEIQKRNNSTDLDSQDWEVLIPMITSLTVSPVGNRFDDWGQHHVILDPDKSDVEIELVMPSNLRIDWGLIHNLFWSAEAEWTMCSDRPRKFKGKIKNDSLRVYILTAIAERRIHVSDLQMSPICSMSSPSGDTSQNILPGALPLLPNTEK